MKIAVFIFSFMVSLSSLAEGFNSPKICITNGNCQKEFPETDGNICFIVRTSSDGKSCTLRCYSFPIAYYCKKAEGEVLGICKKEFYKTPEFDPANPDCSKAIEPINF